MTTPIHDGGGNKGPLGGERGFFLDLALGGSLFDEAKRELVRLGEV